MLVALVARFVVALATCAVGVGACSSDESSGADHGGTAGEPPTSGGAGLGGTSSASGGMEPMSSGGATGPGGSEGRGGASGGRSQGGGGASGEAGSESEGGEASGGEPSGGGEAGLPGQAGSSGDAGVGGQTGGSGGGPDGCPPGQVWCPGCEPGTGSCGEACVGPVCPECAQADSLEACDSLPNCHPVFEDLLVCGCGTPGCCASFQRCVEGDQADCAGDMIACSIEEPYCEGPPYVVSYTVDCYEGCVRAEDCSVEDPCAPVDGEEPEACFDCAGSARCHQPTEYCDRTWSEARGQWHSTCEPLPDACLPTPSCGCLEAEGAAGDTCAEEDGALTVEHLG